MDIKKELLENCSINVCKNLEKISVVYSYLFMRGKKTENHFQLEMDKLFLKRLHNT